MKSIKTITTAELAGFLKEIKQPAFRQKQILEWLYIHHVGSFDEMTNLPKALRDSLSSEFTVDKAKVFNKRVSKDGTRKYLIELSDGNLVETVAIPSKSSHERLTVCFSTQVGCPMACAFCATGHEGFTRNLGAGEIVEQILVAQEDMGIRVTNLVGMGQGEPFLNYENVLDALHILNNPKGIAIGARKITISTCGIVPGIEKFAQEPEQFTMAVSLHSAIQEKRDQIMPKASRYSLPFLKRALRRYLEDTNRRITFEYLLINGVNDGEEDLKALIEFCDGLLCHINLLQLNDIADSPLKPAPKSVVAAWVEAIEKTPHEVTVRVSRGGDIDGACGQLKNSILSE